MNPFEMVVAIVIVVTIGSVLKARYGIRRDRDGNEFQVRDDNVRTENVQLKGEMGRLKERLAVLERVITDNHASSDLDREIDKLRDRN